MSKKKLVDDGGSIRRCPKLDYSVHMDYCQCIDRFLELVSVPNVSRVNSILVTLGHSISDFNAYMDDWNKGLPVSVDWFRARVYEIDVLLSGFICLRQLLGLNGVMKDCRIRISDDILNHFFGEDAGMIKKFRNLRGLVLAHPFDMGNPCKDTVSIVYLEDVFVGCPCLLGGAHVYETFKDVDFVLDVREYGSDHSEYRAVRFYDDVVLVGLRIMAVLKDMSSDVQTVVNVKLQELRNTNMNIRTYPIEDRIFDLKVATKVRYPGFVNTFEVYSTGETVEKCILDDVLAVLSFCNRFDTGVFADYGNEVRDGLNRYEVDLQDMAFEDTGYCNYLRDVLRPDCDNLYELSGCENFWYMVDKIRNNLSFTDDGFGDGWEVTYIREICESIGCGKFIDIGETCGEIAIRFWALVRAIDKSGCLDALNGMYDV